jgi:hypothetical protein
MNSSASSATANEKTMPATTAMNVIAICITPSPCAALPHIEVDRSPNANLQ